ncbi:GNAT family acetyltransferase [Methylobacterium sp. JK268]
MERAPLIREVRDGDVAGLVALWHAAGVARPWNDPDTDIAFARAAPHATILVAERDGAVVGSAMVGEDGHRGWMYYVAVSPDLQASGIGRAIVQAAEIWLAARGIWKVQLLVRADNARAVGFYERLGYRDVGTTCLQKVIAPAGDGGAP